jgi:hypothetical protein
MCDPIEGEKDHLPILNIFVPHTGQIPWVAGFPFFIVTFFSSFIDLFDLHLTQYASMAMQPVKQNKKRGV